jgi:hypothetical protein
MFALLPLAALALPALTSAAKQCGPYDTQSMAGYTLYANGWAWDAGRGEQCSEIKSVVNNTVAWETDYTWLWAAGNQYQVKTYTNVQPTNFTSKKLKEYKSIKTAWDWEYKGVNLSCNGESLRRWNDAMMFISNHLESTEGENNTLTSVF